MVQLSHLYVTTEKNYALTIWTFVSKVMSLLFNILSGFIIAFLPRSKHVLILCLQSQSAVTLNPKKIKPVMFPFFPHLFSMKWWERRPWSSFFECGVLSQLFHSPFPRLSRGSLVPLRLDTIRVVSSAYLRLLIFLLASWFQLVIHPAFCTLHFVVVSSVTQLCPTLCDPMDCSMPGFPVHHQLVDLAQTRICWVSDAMEPSWPLSFPFSSCLQDFPASVSFLMS